MTTTLVLGGAGFIGRHVAAALAARGHAVVIATAVHAARGVACRRACTPASGAKCISSA